MKNKKKREILDKSKISRAVTRIAHEILERNSGAESLVIVGILTRGAILAKRLAAIIKDIEGVDLPVGLMDISLYRDDVNSNPDQPIVRTTEILFDISDKNLILVDDVLFTGRTIRAALSQLVEFGRSRTIQLAVLVDRGHRQLPIRADYVGKNIPTNFDDNVRVYFQDSDDIDEVVLYPAGEKNSEPEGGDGK
ncbi:MAG: bifunctional pyr operon transcriptional regulator/uracil phosphoribosyltransferase PyrR [candidate division Zixibacteria bacterium]